ncbi:LamG-like jellyroll fold domain-containing protein [Pseudochryseolinea flava]|uniref:LamG domain-containing protein n=1 Tax=Pseudochryseolinea flava TaxID=2059302 RepID=A0A364Y1G3_9BACT|nr:LamG-like jellyroll fold domain-containing protein [Pseudochryseolinea flava]RAW00673.1 hypothetical protein DQQ10_13875 [Pseudochryseolinea flava]
MKTKLNYWLMAGVVAMATITSCGSDDDDSLPPIDGYNNSNEVSSGNLLAHWSFDDTNSERISNTAASNTYGSVTYTTGQIGNALKLDQGALVYPTINAINTANALNNYTVSLWVNITNNKRSANSGFTSLFSLIPTNATDVWGDVNACVETSRHLPSSDTLELKNLQRSHTEGGVITNDNLAMFNDDTDKGKWFMGAKKWAHYVMTWNATTNEYKLYANGSSHGAYDARNEGGIMIMDVPVKAVFGSLASSDIGFAEAGEQRDWNPWATAMIDDVRVYNTVLSQVEITALYNLGVAGR